MRKSSPLIALIDMDCFYVQVEWHEAPSFKGQPSAVVQYNTWRGGSIIAVSYEARDKGVTRGMRGDDARDKCPGIHLFSVPENRGKADLTRYRNAGADVIKCLSSHSSLIERASVDEAYIDLTDEVDNLLIAASDHEDIQSFWRREQISLEGCHSVGYESYETWLDHVWRMKESDEFCDDIRIALASHLVKKMRDDVYATLGYRCSAGIAHSKVTAKYACGVHKPNQQTTVSSSHVATLFHDASINKIRNLGGKLGTMIQDRLQVSTVGQLSRFSLTQLTESFGDRTGPWLYWLCRGNDDEGVVARRLTQSIGCSKTFPGAAQLDTVEKVRHWLSEMAEEIVERVGQDRSNNGREPSHLCVTYRQLRPDQSGVSSKKSVSGSRVVPMARISVEAITASAMVVLAGINNAGHKNMSEQAWHPPLLALGLSAGKFRAEVAKNDISRYLVDVPIKASTSGTIEDNVTMEQDTGGSLGDAIGGSLVEESGRSLVEEVSIKIEEEGDQNITRVSPVKRSFFARRLEQEELEFQRRNEGQIEVHNKRDKVGKESRKRIKVEEVEPVRSVDEEESMWNEGISSRASESGFVKKIVEEGTPLKGRSFFATRIEHDRLSEEDNTCEMNESESSSRIVASDYFKCDQCGQQVLMWHGPEHYDLHMARDLQKKMYREVMDEDAKKRRALHEVTVASSSSKKKDTKNVTKKKPTSDGHRTIESFFPKKCPGS